MYKMVIITLMLIITIVCPVTGNTDELPAPGLEIHEAPVEDNAVNREEYVVSKLRSHLSSGRNNNTKAKTQVAKNNGRDVTILLREAVKDYDSWSDESRAIVDIFLKRPDDTTNEWPWSSDSFYLPTPVSTFEPDVSTYPNIGGKFKFWYVTHSTEDTGGYTHTSTLAHVESMAASFETVYNTIINTMGYPAPPDDSQIAHNGGDSKMDVYVMDCGVNSIYGYTVLEQFTATSPSFMVMDNDYSEFIAYNGTAERAMQVTAAHEFHHVVQFGINTDAEDWIMEATSTWMEDQVYDSIDDNLQYLNGSIGFFANPHQSLDSEFQNYNSWIWLEYLETKWNQALIKNMWVDYLSGNGNGITAATGILSEKNTSFRTAFTEFAKVNYAQQGFYSDYQVYNSVNIANLTSETGFNLDYRTASSDIFGPETLTVDHLAVQYFKLTPGSSISSENDDTLYIHVDGTKGRNIDIVPLVTAADLSVTQKDFSFNSSNDATIEVADFNTTSVSSVVLVLLNYSPTEDSSGFVLRGGIGADGADNTHAVTTVVEDDTNNGGCFISSLKE